MKKNLPQRISREPTNLEKCKSAEVVSMYASASSVLTMVVAWVMSQRQGDMGKMAVNVAILLMFLSAVSCGSGMYAFQGLKERKTLILATMGVSVLSLIVYMAMTFS